MASANYNTQVKQYLKRNEKNLYHQYRTSLSNPVALVNQVVRHYQWIYEIQDYTYLDLQDRANKNYLNLFLYGLEASDELASDFINYFVFSFKNAFDVDTRTWNIDLIFNTFIHQCSYHEFDLIAMYALIGATFDRFTKFIIRMKINPKLSMTLKDIVNFFELIINQEFYNDLKKEVNNKRKNSFYFKTPDIDVVFPSDRVIEPWERKHKSFKTVRKTYNKKDLEMLKRAQANSEAQFEKWEEVATDLDPDMIEAGARKDSTKNAIPYAHNPGDILKGRTNYQGSANDGSRDVEIPDIMKAKADVEETSQPVEETPVETKKTTPIKMIKLTVGPISQQQKKK